MSIVYQYKEFNRDRQISSNNLGSLLAFAADRSQISSEKVTTKIAMDCFRDIQQSRLGLGHYLKKYAAGTAAFTAAVGIPTMLVLGGTYYYASEKMKDPFDFLKVVLAGVGIGGANRATGAMFGVKPVTMMATMAGASLIYGAGKLSEAVMGQYNQIEKRAEDFARERHGQIIEQLKTTYEDIANELERRFKKALMDPKDVYELKQSIFKLEESMPSLREAFSKIGIGVSEASQILGKLHDLMIQIRSHEFPVRSAKSPIDSVYNLKLMTDLPPEAASSIALSVPSKLFVMAVDQNRLGLSHDFQTYAVPAMIGTATAVGSLGCAAAVTAVACSQIFEIGQQALQGNVGWETIPAGGAFTLALTSAAALTAKTVRNSYNKLRAQKVQADEVVRQNTQAAKEELTAIYDGIAQELDEKRKRYIQSPASIVDFSRDLDQIKLKLPAIHKKLQQLGIFKDSQEVTQRLRDVIRQAENDIHEIFINYLEQVD